MTYQGKITISHSFGLTICPKNSKKFIPLSKQRQLINAWDLPLKDGKYIPKGFNFYFRNSKYGNNAEYMYAEPIN